MKNFSLVFFLCSLLIQISSKNGGVLAQFGIPKKQAAGDGAPKEHQQQEATIGANGDVQVPKEITDLAIKLMTVDAALSEQDALDIASIMDTAKHDKDTKIMLQKMKIDQPEAFAGTAESSPLEILKGIEQAYEELKMLEVLFQDKERALREMTKEGMIPEEKLSIYQTNPDLLETDIRRGLYFMFVALAEAGGYL